MFAEIGNSKTRHGESGALYLFIIQSETGVTNVSRKNLRIVWQDSEQDRELVAKEPFKDDDKTQRWPAFQHEVKMQQLYKDDKMIRPMVNFLPSSDIDEPMTVLKPFKQTIWDARDTRPMTTAEIK